MGLSSYQKRSLAENQKNIADRTSEQKYWNSTSHLLNDPAFVGNIKQLSSFSPTEQKAMVDRANANKTWGSSFGVPSYDPKTGQYFSAIDASKPLSYYSWFSPNGFLKDFVGKSSDQLSKYNFDPNDPATNHVASLDSRLKKSISNSNASIDVSKETISDVEDDLKGGALTRSLVGGFLAAATGGLAAGGALGATVGGSSALTGAATGAAGGSVNGLDGALKGGLLGGIGGGLTGGELRGYLPDSVNSAISGAGDFLSNLNPLGDSGGFFNPDALAGGIDAALPTASDALAGNFGLNLGNVATTAGGGFFDQGVLNNITGGVNSLPTASDALNGNFNLNTQFDTGQFGQDGGFYDHAQLSVQDAIPTFDELYGTPASDSSSLIKNGLKLLGGQGDAPQQQGGTQSSGGGSALQPYQHQPNQALAQNLGFAFNPLLANQRRFT